MFVGIEDGEEFEAGELVTREPEGVEAGEEVTHSSMGVTRAQQEAHHLLHQVVEVTVGGTPGAGRTRLHGFRGLAIERKKTKT